MVIDLDDCRDPETGEIQQWAQEIVRRLGSYTEISPSGRGLHIIATVRDKSNLPAGRKMGNIEFYTCNRYITITGNRLENAPSEIQELVQELFGDGCNGKATEEAGDIPSDAEVQTLLRVADQLVPDCRNLLWGDWPDYRTDGLDRSGLEFMLARRLVEAGLKDPRTIACVLFGSAIHRAKVSGRSLQASWKLALDCATHALEGGRTADGETAQDASEALLSHAVPYDEWVNNAVEAEPIWDGLLYRGIVHLVAAPAKRGKSRFLHDLLAHLTLPELSLRVQGQEIPLLDGYYWGRKYSPGLRALVITEEPRSVWRKREIPLGRVNFLPTFVVRKAGSEAIAEIIRRNIYDIILIDTIDKIFQLKDENDNAGIINNLDPLVEATHESTTALVLVHHHRKAGGSGGDEVRGGTALLGSVDVYLAFKGVKGQPRAREIEVLGRFDPPDTPLIAVLTDTRFGTYELLRGKNTKGRPQEGGGSGAKALSTSQAKVLEYLKSNPRPATPAGIAAATGLKPSAVRKALQRLVEAALVKRVGRGMYCAVEGTGL